MGAPSWPVYVELIHEDDLGVAAHHRTMARRERGWVTQDLARRENGAGI